jgi:hypothetical protein
MRFIGLALVGMILLSACSQYEPHTNLDSQIVGGWQNVGGGLYNQVFSSYPVPHMALSPTNKPFVTFSNNSNVFVKTWNGTLWRDLGNVRNNATLEATRSDITVNASGTPLVTWVEAACASCEGNVYVKRRVGTSWTQLGGKVNSRPARDPVIALDKNGVPYVAFGQGFYLEPTSDLYVKVFKNGVWSTLGGALDVNTTHEKRAAKLVIDNNGNPIVAWLEVNVNVPGDIRGYIKRWNGSSWQLLGSDTDDVFAIDLALDSSGLPYRARVIVTGLTQETKRYDLFVEKWSGSGWRMVGADFLNSSLYRVSYISLEIDGSDRPVIAYTEDNAINSNNNQIFVKRFVGNGWQYLGRFVNRALNDAALPLGTSSTPDLAIDANGLPLVTFVEESSVAPLNIYVNQFRP